MAIPTSFYIFGNVLLPLLVFMLAGNRNIAWDDDDGKCVEVVVVPELETSVEAFRGGRTYVNNDCIPMHDRSQVLIH